MDTSAMFDTIKFAEIQELRFASSSLPSDEADPAVNNDEEDPAVKNYEEDPVVNIYEEILAVNNLMKGPSIQCNFKQNSSHKKDAHQYPRRHRLTLKLSCAGLILVLILIGISVSVGILVQKPPRVNETETTGRSAILTCPTDWHPYLDRCLFSSQIFGSWAEGQADCSARGATLLFIENEEELKFIHDFSKREKKDFFFGLNHVPAEKIWKWINGSILNPDVLQNTRMNGEKSCAIMLQRKKVTFDSCFSNNYWICQKKLKLV